MAGKQMEEVTVQVTSPDGQRIRTGDRDVNGISVLILLKLEGEEAVELHLHNLAGYRQGKTSGLRLNIDSHSRVESWAAGLDCEEPKAVVRAVEQALKDVLNTT